MAAELQVPAIEFRVVDGLEARALDPDGLEWPESARVVFAIEDGEVVGRSSMYPLPSIRITETPLASILLYDLIEGTWVREDKRSGLLAVRLIKFVEQLFRDNGKTHAFAFSYDEQPEVGVYLERFNYKRVPFTVWQKQLVEE